MLELVKEKPLVEIRGLTKNFGYVTALDDVDINIPRGEIIGLLGENGSGKTTLLKVLAGLYMRYDGSVLIDEGRLISPRQRCHICRIQYAFTV